MACMTRLAAAGTVVLFMASVVCAWHAKGHMTVTRSAVEMAATATMGSMPATSPDSRPAGGGMPGFFRRGVEMISRSSPQPDLFTKPVAPHELHDAEASEHYFDIEMLGNPSTQPGQNSWVTSGQVPGTRYEFIDWCSRNNVKPPRVGLLPYAIIEWTQRLTLALAEYRAFPDDPNVQARCLLYAGILSHYSADLCQPLHTTIHYDGRAKADGSSPHSGIHNKVDALLGKLRPKDLAAALADKGVTDGDSFLILKRESRISPPKYSIVLVPAGVRTDAKHETAAGKAPSETTVDEGAGPMAFKDLMPAVLGEFARSHALVARVYELEPKLPAWDEAIPKEGADDVIAFAKQRYRRAVTFTASLYLTAWRDSAAIQLPPWAHIEKEPQVAR